MISASVGGRPARVEAHTPDEQSTSVGFEGFQGELLRFQRRQDEPIHIGACGCFFTLGTCGRTTGWKAGRASVLERILGPHSSHTPAPDARITQTGIRSDESMQGVSLLFGGISEGARLCPRTFGVSPLDTNSLSARLCLTMRVACWTRDSIQQLRLPLDRRGSLWTNSGKGGVSPLATARARRTRRL